MMSAHAPRVPPSGFDCVGRRRLARGLRSAETGSEWTVAKEVTRLQQRVAELNRELELQRAVDQLLHEGATASEHWQGEMARRLLQVGLRARAGVQVAPWGCADAKG